MLMDTASSPGPAAVAECDLAALEVAGEPGPFLIGRGAVLLGRPHRPPPRDERPVAGDGLLGVDGLIAHGGGDRLMTADQLGDVRGHAVHDRVGDP